VCLEKEKPKEERKNLNESQQAKVGMVVGRGRSHNYYNISD